MAVTTELPSYALSTEPPQYEDRVRVHVFFYRKPGLTQEEFHHYWRNTHSKIFGDLPIVRKNLIKYEQTHYFNDAAQAAQKDGFPVADYDGIVIFDVSSYDKFTEVLASKEYNEIVVPDEEKFLDRKRYVAYPTRVVTVFDNSK
ncbi:MAG: hypothetical protein M1838_000500 [Thelocarpon superellum]|nr:MAG: hypothetical protein M1838_000500 [Thelocarpon superellum]